MKVLSGWGRYPKIKTTELIPNSESQLLEIISNSKSYIARGNGRSYGDSSINQNLTITMAKMNRLISWNQEKGELVAESGVLLSDILDIFLPKGWFPYVTPGTKFITLGGAIACDVHGKNHHLEGSFGNHVNWIDLINNKNEIIRCSPSENTDLFHCSVGGMGLTGVIIRCSINLKKVESGWIKQKLIVNDNLRDTLQSFYDHNDANYSVAWIDCLATGKSMGRSILMLGEHAAKNEIRNKNKAYPIQKKQKFSLTFNAPSFLLNKLSISLFNKLYFNFNKKKDNSLIDWDSYFYPLDSIGDWNRMYGKNGFFQFQCLLPNESSFDGYTKILSIIQNQSSGSFLAVLKQFGCGNKNLSFPREGFTLALDFQATKKNIDVGKELIDLVNELGGTIYLAKDSMMNGAQYDLQIHKNEKDQFLRFRNNFVESEQSNRLKL